MAYTPFDGSKPNGGSPHNQTGTQFGQSARDNFNAIRDAVMMGTMPGFNYSQTGGTAEQPATIYYKKGAEWLRGALTWGTVGGEAGNVTVAVYSYSANSGGAWDAIGTETNAYDANGNCTTTTWS